MGKPRKQRELPRVQNIELQEKNTTLRWILAGALLLIGLVAIAFGVNSCVGAQEGWQEVMITSDKTNCSADFVFNYQYGQTDEEPTLERRQVVACYSSAVEDAWELFNTDVEGSSLGNLSLLNAHPNEVVEVDAGLYRALEQVVESESRYLYLAALYDEYDRIFLAESEAQAAEFDPSKNGELLPYIQQALAFAVEPAHIRLELLGEGKVKLQVSEDYLAFFREYGNDTYLDFGWMKNAFIADYLAQRLIDEGHTNGYLASFDGFTRNLDSRDHGYSLNLFDRLGQDVYMPAVMAYSAPMSVVFLRNYPMSTRDSGGYYLFADKTIATGMIDLADGLYKSSTDNLVSYSENLGCGEIVLNIAPLFVTDKLDTAALNGLTAEGIYSVWFDGGRLLYNQQNLELTMQQVEGAAYAPEYAGK